MIGIYKITSPSGKVYIGQSVQIEKRRKKYSRLSCVNQTKLYNSLVKYGFSEHIFVVVEECRVEELNIRERYWQDFYEVLGVRGLNCILTATDTLKYVFSQETKDIMSAGKKAFYKTEKGKISIAKTVAAIDHKAFQGKRLASIDYKARTVNTDYKARTKNTDWAARTASMDYSTIAKKNRKLVIQYSKDGTFIKEWESLKQAGEELGIQRTNISKCSRHKIKYAGGFIWEYKS
tara:strand:- start:417 stop:1118 length:702 start_codon:yes stop_codon:yes gene_type:complete